MKKKILLLGLILSCICASQAVPSSSTTTTTKDLCEDDKVKCFQTEYKSYVKCIEKQRAKRQACAFAESSPAQIISTIGHNQPYIQPSSQIIIDNCLNSCATSCNGNSCRERCDNSCQNPTPQQYIQQQPQIIQQQPHIVPIVQSPSQPASSPNITTMIKLTNIVNNTNVINVPTTINNTNINNLELVTNSSSKTRDNEKCCMVVQPKTCQHLQKTNNSTTYRCIHRKHHTCGDQCQSQTLHAQVRQPCNGPPATCPPAVSYVPQPNPNCFYQQSWPYVTCGTNGNPSCEGCYDHYGYGFENYHGDNPPNCGGCYDDGYDQGALYRQGPFYRPGYYHTPPCYLTNTCNSIEQPLSNQPMDCGYGGCFGHEMIDPVFGAQSYSPYAYQSHYHSVLHTPTYYNQAPQYGYYAPYYAPMADVNEKPEIVVVNNTKADENPFDKKTVIPLNATSNKLYYTYRPSIQSGYNPLPVSYAPYSSYPTYAPYLAPPAYPTSYSAYPTYAPAYASYSPYIYGYPRIHSNEQVLINKKK